MTALQQYALLFAMVISSIGLVAMLRLIAQSLSKVRVEKGKEIPFTGGTLTSDPARVRYHAHCYKLSQNRLQRKIAA